MTISTIKHCAIFLIMFICCAKFAYAEVVINEFVSYPNSGEIEWIELLNKDTSPQDLNGWKLTQLSNPSTDPKEDNPVPLSGILPANGGILTFNIGTATSGKLNNSGDSISLYDSESSLVDRVTYGDVVNMSADLDSPSQNKSGAFISGSWKSDQTPTKNSPNTSVNVSNEETTIDTEDTTSSISSTSNSSTPKEVPIILKITTKIISPKTVIAGIPFSINSLTTTNRGQTYLTGKFVWNFGDGKMSEARQGLPFEYTYEYPGDYALNLTYFESYLSESSSASDRIIIKVVPSEVYINGVGDVLDPFVEIGNKSSNEIFLSNWVITAGIHYFIIPEGTTLLPGKKIKLSPKITGFTGEDIRYVVITNPNNIISATYPNIIAKKVVQKSSSASVNNTSAVEKVTQDNLPTNNSQIINLNELGASAGDSGIKVSKLAYSIVGLFVIIGLGIMSFILIKKKDKAKDYLEKEIRAEDMTIIE